MFSLPAELRTRIWGQARYLHAKAVLHGHLIQRASRQQVKEFGLPHNRISALLVMLPCRRNLEKVFRFHLSLDTDTKALTYCTTCDMIRVKVRIQHTAWGTFTSIYDHRIVEFWDSHPGPFRRDNLLVAEMS